MQIGIFENTKSSLYDLMKDLSKELDFTLNIIEGLDDSAMVKIDGLVVQNNFKSANDIAKVLKRFKNIILLDSEQASSIVTPELGIICEEANVELMVAGPNINPEVFRFMERHTQTPYYVRGIKELAEIEDITFEMVYRLLYWNAYFSEGEIRKFKINSIPAVNEKGILFYGRTESAINIPVDIWLSNLGFEPKELIKVFAQDKVIDIDLANNLFFCKNKDGLAEECYIKPAFCEYEAYIRSFVEQLKSMPKKNLNTSLSKFLRLVEFYQTIQQKANL